MSSNAIYSQGWAHSVSSVSSLVLLPEEECKLFERFKQSIFKRELSWTSSSIHYEQCAEQSVSRRWRFGWFSQPHSKGTRWISFRKNKLLQSFEEQLRAAHGLSSSWALLCCFTDQLVGSCTTPNTPLNPPDTSWSFSVSRVKLRLLQTLHNSHHYPFLPLTLAYDLGNHLPLIWRPVSQLPLSHR